MGLFIDPAQAHLGAEGHQRGAVRLGVGHPEQQVDGPGAEGGEADPRLAGDPAVHVGHEGGRLFRTHQDKAHGGLVEGIHQVDDLLAGEAEDVLYPFILQAPGNELRHVHLYKVPSFEFRVSRKTRGEKIFLVAQASRRCALKRRARRPRYHGITCPHTASAWHRAVSGPGARPPFYPSSPRCRRRCRRSRPAPWPPPVRHWWSPWP